ncbi:hypothetical protein [Halovivax sp.]|uniref:helix-turn-helix transcriptional regulator n=1 Tax=Halovivax sp. TaxID=1935978 RepID=UPI0025B7F773|nr:hypothetical protein [Halovivax sp.]
MRVPSALLLVLAVALLLSVGLGTIAAEDDTPEEGALQDIRIELTADGDAVWSVEHHFLLDGEEDIEQFESYAEEVRTDQRGGATYSESFENFVPLAEERTNNEMSIEAAGWEEPTVRPVEEVDAFEEFEDDEFPDNATVGTLTFSFTWTEFAETDDDRVDLQDTFLTEAGHPWYGSLRSNERLIIEAPEEYDFVTAPHGIDGGQLAWVGPHEFEDGDFDIVLEHRSSPLDTLVGSWMVLVGGLALLVVVGSAWYAMTQQDYGIELPSPPAYGTESNDATAGDGGTTSGDETGSNVASASVVENPDSDAGTLADDDADDEIDPELLSDEERVTRMLKANGGRMKQAAIVKETGWSNAKVSQLLSKMDEDDEIEKLRIGRENLITLPDVDPTQIE